MTRIPVAAKADGSGTLHPRRGAPATFGVPLPRGTAHDRDRWSTIDVGGVRRPVQTRVMDRWADGSVRWLLVDAQIDIDSSGAQFFLEPVAAEAIAGVRAVSVSQNDDAVVVDTGAATFRLRPAGGRTPEPIVIAGTPQGEVPITLRLVDRDGAECSTTIQAIDIVDRGPLRAAVHVSGTSEVDGAEFLLVDAFADFYAGSSTARLRVSLTNPRASTHAGGFWDLGDPGSVLVKDATLSIALPAAADRQELRYSPERGAPWQSGDMPFEIYQDSSGGEHWNSPNHVNRERRVPLAFRGYRLTSGAAVSNALRATPIVAVRRGDASVAVAVPYFWENFPKAIEVDGRAIHVGLFPRQHADVHELQGGERKTHEVFVSVGSETVTADPLEWCRVPLVGCVDPAWTLSTGAVPFLAPLGDAHATLVGAAVDGPDRFEQKREVVDEYGWRHFGEIYGDHEAVRHKGPNVLVSHYNNQYDPVAGFAYQFLRTGDPRWRRMMIELATHVLDIDIYHTTRDKAAYNHGLFWHTYHYGDADTATHRTYPRSAQGRTHGGGPSADHNYTTGLMHYYFMTGDPVARTTVVDSGQFVIDMDDGRRTPFRWLDRGDTGRAALSAPGYYGAGRAAANSLNALLDAHRVSGEARFLEKAERLIRRVIHPTETIAERRLDVPEQRWFYTMFLQSLGKYLRYKAERSELDAAYAYGRESLLHYARWMAEHEHPYLENPEKLEFKTETWAAQDIRKSDAFYFAAMHAGGDERARFIERGRFYHDYSTSTLQQWPTRALARPVAVLLTSGLVRSSFEREPQQAAPAPSVTAAFGDVERFVPQRQRAQTRAMIVAGLGAVAALLVLAMLILR